MIGTCARVNTIVAPNEIGPPVNMLMCGASMTSGISTGLTSCHMTSRKPENTMTTPLAMIFR